jgi:chromosome segregation ATPase
MHPTEFNPRTHSSHSTNMPGSGVPQHEATARYQPFPIPEPQAAAEESTRKRKRFRVLNDLELTGVRAECEILQRRFERDRDPKTHVKLLEFQMKELQHCYQLKKDGIRGKDARIAQIEGELKAKVAELEDVKQNRESVLKQKRKRDEEYEQLERKTKAKIQKLEDTTQKLEEAQTAVQKSTQRLKERERAYQAISSDLEQTQKMLEASLRQLEEQRKLTAEFESRLAQEEILKKSYQTRFEETNQRLTESEEERTLLRREKGSLESKNEKLHKYALQMKEMLLSIQESQKTQLEQITSIFENQED